MINAHAAQPLYEQIKLYLLHKINMGEFPPHTPIPSERILSEEFGVSRMTARHAIRELVAEGRLYTKVGKGTFVSESPITQQLDTLTGFSEDMLHLGKHTSSRVLQAEQIIADERLSKLLRYPLHSPLILLKRIRLAEGQPVAIESSYLAGYYCTGILDNHDFARESLYDVLRTVYQVKLSYAEQTMMARLATKKEALLLGIDEQFPILHIKRVTFSEGDMPIEYVESAYRGDRYIFRAKLKNI